MAQPATQILGRKTELASLGDFVTAAREDPVALLIDGDPRRRHDHHLAGGGRGGSRSGVPGVGLSARRVRVQARAALVLTKLSVGDAANALVALGPVPDLLAGMGLGEPGAFPCLPDAVDA